MSKSPCIGLALGSGAARGWAHIGVLRALSDAGVRPDIVCGCSIGGFVGAVYAHGDLDSLESWVSAMGWQDVLALLDFRFSGGFIKGEKLMRTFVQRFVNCDFPDLPMPFGCVATDLQTGHEVWLREGNVAEAVRASIAIPGLFSPVLREGRLLVDGGLVNPVPVSLAKAMGADIVIAVDLASDLVGRAWRNPPAPTAEEELAKSPSRGLLKRIGFLNPSVTAEAPVVLPSMSTIIASAIQIMQVRITRSRLAGEPADVVISPRLGQLGVMDFHRGREAIAEGTDAVVRMMPAIRHMLSN